MHLSTAFVAGVAASLKGTLQAIAEEAAAGDGGAAGGDVGDETLPFSWLTASLAIAAELAEVRGQICSPFCHRTH